MRFSRGAWPAPVRVPGPALAVAALGMILLAGCMVAPSDEAGNAPAPVADPSPRSKNVTEPRTLPVCVRIWSETALDSIWDCPDPRPPALITGKSG